MSLGGGRPVLRRVCVLGARYPYGGATTTYEALLLGVPVVSTPGPALRGRFTRALLARMGLGEWLVPLPALARAAVSVGRARAAAGGGGRRKDRARVAGVASEALEDAEALHEWARFLARAVAAARRGLGDAGAGDVPCGAAALAACAEALGDERPYVVVLDPDLSSGRPLEVAEDGGVRECARACVVVCASPCPPASRNTGVAFGMRDCTCRRASVPQVVITALFAGAVLGRTVESCVAVDGGPGGCFNGSVAPHEAPGYSVALTDAAGLDAGAAAAACARAGGGGCAPDSPAARVCAETWTAFVPGACGTLRRLWSTRFIAGRLGAGEHSLRVWLQARGVVLASDERAFRVPEGAA